MIINHNVTALNTHNKLSAASAAQSKSMEKLASGLRINKAGDDAAGLAISEKMRAQVRGLDQAGRNAQDGISLIQTAEGALNETHDILQRMRELAVQSGNDTSTDNDRKEIQKEFSQLKTEIDRISNTTEFNTKSLLNGNLSGAKSAQGTILETVALKTGGSLVTSGAAATTQLQSLTDESGNNLGLRGGDAINLSGIKNGVAISSSFTVSGNSTTSAALEGGTADQTSAALTVGDTIAFEYDGQVYSTTIGTGQGVAAGGSLATVASNLQTALRSATGNTDINVVKSATTGASNDTLTFSSASGKDVKILATGTTTTDTSLKTALTGASSTNTSATNLSNLLTTVSNMTGAGSTATITNGKIEVTGVAGTANSLSNLKMEVSGRSLFNNKLSSLKETQQAQDTKVDSSLSLQIGANQSQTMSIDVNEMSVRSLSLASTDVSTQQGAQTAITVVQNAVDKVSSERAKLGANQNRLEHTINNLKTSSENLTAAESRVRDVDMAKEMMNQTKNSILAQAAQAMLAQANQQPQGVLQLLR